MPANASRPPTPVDLHPSSLVSRAVRRRPAGCARRRNSGDHRRDHRGDQRPTQPPLVESHTIAGGGTHPVHQLAAMAPARAQPGRCSAGLSRSRLQQMMRRPRQAAARAPPPGERSPRARRAEWCVRRIDRRHHDAGGEQAATADQSARRAARLAPGLRKLGVAAIGADRSLVGCSRPRRSRSRSVVGSSSPMPPSP